jgi:hypothetical protein
MLKKTIALIGLTLSLSANAAPIFFVEANSYPALDPNRDAAWQVAVGNSFSETDLDSLTGSVSAVTLGGVNIDIGLGGGAVSSAEMFYGSFASGGGGYGTVSGGALLNRSSGVVYSQMDFEFSTAVEGFGAWIFDDGSESAEFYLIVTEVGGVQYTSSILSGGNVNSFFVEGFLGVTSDVGISGVEIHSVGASYRGFFEVDHLQLATLSPVPIPAAAWLFGSALLGLGAMKRKKA